QSMACSSKRAERRQDGLPGRVRPRLRNSSPRRGEIMPANGKPRTSSSPAGAPRAPGGGLPAQSEARGAAPLCAVGHVFIHRKEPAKAFQHLQSAFTAGDIRFGNCEGVYSLTREVSPVAPHGHLRGEPENVSALTSAGFDVMSFANNVALHCGYSG